MGKYFQEHHEKQIESYLDSPEKQGQLYKRTLWIVVLSQIFSGAGLAAGITVGALLAKQMLGTDQFAGVPIALFTLGSAVSAMLVGMLSQRYGRRLGLSVGFFFGGVGALGVILAAYFNSISLLLFSLFIYGAGMATNLQARYAGTDLANANQRAKAVSMAMVATTFGAVAGPNLVEVTGRFASGIGFPSLSGPFMLAAAAYILAGLVIFVLLRPDPLLMAKALNKVNEKASQNKAVDGEAFVQNHHRGIWGAAVLMVVTQLVMIAIMTMTPVHMGLHGHGVSAVGLIIGFHIGAMFLPSLLTGYLVDQIGRMKMAIASAITLLAAGLVCAFAPGDSLFLLIFALVLLGLGWNFGLISGTATLIDSTTVSNRAKTQGSIDVVVAVSGASGGLLSGVIVAHSSFAFLSVSGGLFSLLLIPVVVWASRERKESIAIDRSKTL
jgi:MFS family permease